MAQHSLPELHCVPAALQVGGVAQTPLLQLRPVQQVAPAPQLSPDWRHVGADWHTPLVQLTPVPQQSALLAHVCPTLRQLAEQVPPQKGVDAQHCAEVVHASPVPPQLSAPHSPWLHVPEQQVPLPHDWPSGTHAETA